MKFNWLMIVIAAGISVGITLAHQVNRSIPTMIEQHASLTCMEFLPYAQSAKDSTWLYAWKPKDSPKTCGVLLHVRKK